VNKTHVQNNILRSNLTDANGFTISENGINLVCRIFMDIQFSSNKCLFPIHCNSEEISWHIGEFLLLLRMEQLTKTFKKPSIFFMTVRGKPVSGRVWKTLQTRPSSAKMNESAKLGFSY
jgi:hypothetical protein